MNKNYQHSSVFDITSVGVFAIWLVKSKSNISGDDPESFLKGTLKQEINVKNFTLEVICLTVKMEEGCIRI